MNIGSIVDYYLWMMTIHDEPLQKSWPPSACDIYRNIVYTAGHSADRDGIQVPIKTWTCVVLKIINSVAGLSTWHEGMRIKNIISTHHMHALETRQTNKWLILSSNHATFSKTWTTLCIGNNLNQRPLQPKIASQCSSASAIYSVRRWIASSGVFQDETQ